MSHPFGDLLHQHLHRRHGLTQSKLAEGILQDPAVISNMCHGRRLVGQQARERIVDIIGWLRTQDVLTTQGEADALLHAAGLIGLQTNVPEEVKLLAMLSPVMAERAKSSHEQIAVHLDRSNDIIKLGLSGEDNAARTNLPLPTTSFSGRQRELEQLMARVAQPDCRLLSLVGPGGFGKTRLGIRVGELVLASSALAPDGVFFVALDQLESPAWVVPAIAAALDFSFGEQVDQEHQLLSYLRHKQLLLILDNAEGILDSELVVKILGGTSKLKLLVTTREALNLHEEWFHPIGGMSLVKGDGADRTMDGDAIGLFNRCAMRVNPNFEPVREHAHVQAICRSVDGVPLAIELAAAWLKALSCEQVASEVSQSIDILTSSMHDVPERHRSLRAVLEQSWHHLSDEEQRVFRQLSIFANGFLAPAAQNVTDASLAVLAGLIDKSVLQLSQTGRYRIHALLYEMGEERMAANAAEQAGAAQRHSTYYLKSISHPASMYLSDESRPQIDAIKAEINNIFAAWYWAVDHGKARDLRMAMEGMYWFSWLSTYHEECEKAFSYAIQTLRDGQDDNERQIAYAFALTCHGTMSIWLGHDQAKNQELLESVALLRKLPAARHELAFAVGGLGWSVVADSRFEEAMPLLYEAVELDQETEQFELQAWIYCLLGITTRGQNDHQESEQWYQQALQLGRGIGDQRTITHALYALGRLASQRGEYTKAHRYLDESLLIARGGNLHGFVVGALGELGKLAEGIGKLELASDYFQQGVDVAQGWGKEGYIAVSLGRLAQICTVKGDFDAAADLYREAIDPLVQIQNSHPFAVELWAGMGKLALYTHDYVAARLHYEECLALSRQSGDRLASAEALAGLGLATLRQGNRAAARHHLCEALQIGLLIGFAPVLLATVTAVAELLAADGELAYAAELAVLARRHTTSTAATKASANKLLARAMQGLSSEAYTVVTNNIVDSKPEDVARKLATELFEIDETTEQAPNILL